MSRQLPFDCDGEVRVDDHFVDHPHAKATLRALAAYFPLDPSP